MLFSEGDSHDRYAQDQPHRQMFDRQRNAGEDNPQNIDDQRDRAVAPADVLPERTARQARKFEANRILSKVKIFKK